MVSCISLNSEDKRSIFNFFPVLYTFFLFDSHFLLVIQHKPSTINELLLFEQLIYANVLRRL
jgi:hypothetical protein